MDIVLKIFAGLTGLFGASVLFAAFQKNFNHLGMTLGGFTYLVGGFFGLYLHSWWPAVTGIILAIIIRKIFGEPDYERSPDYGVALTKKETRDIEKVEKFIMTFLKSDPIGVHIFSDLAQKWAESGSLHKFSIEVDKAEPLTNNIFPWFMNRLRLKIQDLPAYTSDEFNQMVRFLNQSSGQYLETIYQITKKYELDIDQFRANPGEYLDMLSVEDGNVVLFAIFADIVVHTELRLLQYLYSWWNPVQTA